MIGFVPGVDDVESAGHAYVPICCLLSGVPGGDDGVGDGRPPDALLTGRTVPLEESPCVATGTVVPAVVAGYRVETFYGHDDLPILTVYRLRPGAGRPPAPA
jgi:hypothetical protein